MIVLTQQQADLVLDILNRVLQGENYAISSLERAIEYINSGRTISCPLEKISQTAATRVLAEEISRSLRNIE